MSDILMRQPMQLGYVTNDLDRAIALYDERYGIRDFLRFDTRDMGSEVALLVALLWIDGVMTELIQSIDTPIAIYDLDLPSDRLAIRFHHIGHLCPDEDSWRRIEEALARKNIPVAYQGETEGYFKFLYADVGPQEDHYREYMFPTSPAGAAFLKDVPHA